MFAGGECLADVVRTCASTFSGAFASSRTTSLAFWTAFAPNTIWRPPVLFELAELDTALGDRARARERLTRAAGILTNIGDQTGLAYCGAQLGAIAERRDNAGITADR